MRQARRVASGLKISLSLKAVRGILRPSHNIHIR